MTESMSRRRAFTLFGMTAVAVPMLMLTDCALPSAGHCILAAVLNRPEQRRSKSRFRMRCLHDLQLSASHQRRAIF